MKMPNVDYTKISLPVAELTNGIVLEEFIKSERCNRDIYQTESEMEKRLIDDLVQGQQYERFLGHSPTEILANLKLQLENLNGVSFSATEWERFLNEYLNKPNEGMVEKTRKIQEDHIYDFVFDDGHVQNISLLDKKNIHRNKLQVMNQMIQKGSHTNRYDVTILVNGLPLVQIELKKRGVPISQAFHQIHRYTKESFNSENSLFQYIQVFVISNGTFTRYFSNTVERNKNNFEFTCEWADRKNHAIHDLEDFAQTFLNKTTLLSILIKFCIFNAEDVLLVMRPYQIAATESILNRIHLAYQNKLYGKVEGGGYIWHTTGSGKTLTSFKTARLATELEYIDKVFFVVDRKDLDYQTMKEYQKFQKDSVNGSNDTKQLKEAIEKDDSRIVVTTIQKLNHFTKKYPNHPIYDKQCVMIYDECHRSQFGDSQKKVNSSFRANYQFGFTGTPIFADNTLTGQTTQDIFGHQLHSYIITDAIRDNKVLKFKVDYNNVAPKFRDEEVLAGHEKDLRILRQIEKKALLAPERISKVVEHILSVYPVKTHREVSHIVKIKNVDGDTLRKQRMRGYNAMLAVQNVYAAKMYYEELHNQQASLPEECRLRIGMIYSFAANEDQAAYGDIYDEDFNPSAMESSAKEFLDRVITDYNKSFSTSFSTESQSFQNYYKDLSQRTKNKEIDLLIVVGMFLTGFDAPTMNTLFVDKNLRYHGLIQAYSRTNRILSKDKPFGNIVCFRDLEKATIDALKLFGEDNNIYITLEKSYQEYMEGFEDEETGVIVRGYKEVCREMLTKFPNPTEIYLESEKKEFVGLFGELLKLDNVLRNFDEFTDEDRLISQGLMQDYRSKYVDIREESYHSGGRDGHQPEIDLSDLEFEIELLKSDEINLDYIIALISEKANEDITKEQLQNQVSRVIRSTIDMRAKERLVMDFIRDSNLDELKDNQTILEAFYHFARKSKQEQIESFAKAQQLQGDYKQFIEAAILRGFASTAGTDLNALMPPTSRRQGAREKKKQEILHQLQELVETFTGI